MTVKYSFLKVMKEDMKRYIWSIVLCFYIFLMQVLAYAMHQPVRGESRGLYLGPGNTSYIAISIAVALICGLQGYSYLFSKKKTDFYFTMPVKRSYLFWAAYLNGLLIFLVPSVLSRLICCQIGIANGYVVMEGAFACTLMGIAVSALGYLLLYHIVILGVMLTGHFVIATAAAGILLFYGKIVLEGALQLYCKAFFYSFYQSELLNRITVYLEPLTLYHYLAGTDQYKDVGEWSMMTQIPYLIAVVFFIVITGFLSYMLYRRRPAEAAGRAIAFEQSQFAVRTLLVVPFSLLSGYFFMLCAGGFSFRWIMTGILVGCILFHGLAEVVFQFNIRGMFSHTGHLLITGILCCCIAGGFYFNTGRYDSYVPEHEQVVSMGISISGLDGSMQTEGGVGPQTDSLTAQRLNSMELTGENMMNALRWMEEITEGGGSAKEHYLTYATVVYRLKSGKSEYRRYGIKTQEQLVLFDKIYRSTEYKEGIFPIAAVHNAQEIIWSNGIETFTVDWETNEREELLQIYREELGAQSILEVKRDDPIGTLNVGEGRMGYLYPTFTKTLDYLKERGIPAEKRVEDYDIKWIIVIHNKEAENTIYNTKNQEMVIDWMKVIRDQKEIDMLKSHLLPSEYAINPLLNPLDMTYELTIKYSDSEGRTAAKAQCVITDSDVFQMLTD